jgi:hypothetical protein
MQNTMQENEKKNALEQKEELNETNLEKVTGGRIRHMSPEKDLSDEDREKLAEFERQIADRM